MMTFINASKIGSKQFLVLAFFLLTVCAHGAPPPGYTLVYTNNFYGHTNASNTSLGGSNFSGLNAAGQGFTMALGYWEIVLTTNNWGYWPDVWLSGSVDKHRTGGSAELETVSPMPGADGKPQSERDWLVALPRGRGDAIFLVSVAPLAHFDQLRPTFERMLRSLVF